MNGQFYDYKKYAILYVDDEEKSLKYFSMAFEKQFRVFTATNAQDGFQLLEKHQNEIALLLSDQRMPGEKGVQLLERARQLRPRILRFLVTAYADMDAAIDAVNSGAIYKYVSKPWDIPQLEMTLRRAMEFFLVQQERDSLLKEKLSVLHNMIITDRVLSLGVLASGLSHHIRNSLVAVQTFLDLAPTMMQAEKMEMNALRNPNFWQEFYQHALTQIDRITDLLGTLCLASEGRHGEFADAARVHEVISQVLAGLADKSAAQAIEITTEIPTDLPAVKVDLPKFTRLFQLLLEDEVVSLPKGSKVTVKARPLVAGSGIEVEVADNGPGLPEEALRAVFDPFFICKDSPKEFGLNLMACYFLIYHHGGKIAIDSRPGKGAIFRLTFPTDPHSGTEPLNEKQFLSRVLMNESLWEKLLTGV